MFLLGAEVLLFNKWGYYLTIPIMLECQEIQSLFLCPMSAFVQLFLNGTFKSYDT